MQPYASTGWPAFRQASVPPSSVYSWSAGRPAAARHLGGERAALADGADEEDLLVLRQLLAAREDAVHGDQRRVGDVAGLVLVRLAHVDDDDAVILHHLARLRHVDAVYAVDRTLRFY